MKRSHVLLALLLCNSFLWKVTCFSNSLDDSKEVEETTEVEEEVNIEVNRQTETVSCPPNYELKQGVCVQSEHVTTTTTNQFNYLNGMRNPYYGGSQYYGSTRPVCAYGSTYNNGVCVSQQGMQSCSSNVQSCYQPSNGYSCSNNMVLYGGGCVSQSIATCAQGFELRNGLCYRGPLETTKCPPGSIFENGACRKDIPCPPNSFFYNGACLQCPPNTIQVNDICMQCPEGMTMRNGQCHCPPGTIRENDRCVLPSPQVSYPMPPNPVAPIVLPFQTVSYVAPIREVSQPMEVRQPIMMSQQQPMQRTVMMQQQPQIMVQPQPQIMVQPQPQIMVQPQPQIMVQPQPQIMVQPQPQIMVQPQPVIMQAPVMQTPIIQSSCSVCP